MMLRENSKTPTCYYIYESNQGDTAELRISKCLKLKKLKEFVFEL